MRVGIDAHKKSCTTSVFADGAGVGESPLQSFVFKTSRAGVSELLAKIPEKSVFVIESSTTGKAITRLLSSTSNHEIHMVAPPEKKPSIKTDTYVDCQAGSTLSLSSWCPGYQHSASGLRNRQAVALH